VYEPGWNAYAAYFDRVAKKLTGCSSGSSSGGDKMIIGPGWDNVSHALQVPAPCTFNQAYFKLYWWCTLLRGMHDMLYDIAKYCAA
jgi:hypothetical protein